MLLPERRTTDVALRVEMDRARKHGITGKWQGEFFGGWTWENSRFSGHGSDERTTVLMFAQRERGFRPAGTGGLPYRLQSSVCLAQRRWQTRGAAGSGGLANQTLVPALLTNTHHMAVNSLGDLFYVDSVNQNVKPANGIYEGYVYDSYPAIRLPSSCSRIQPLPTTPQTV